MTTTERAMTTSPRTSRLTRDVAQQLAETEYRRFSDLLTRLSDAQWRRPTECPPWDVFAMAGHCLGMAEYVASPAETQRQSGLARVAGGVFIDALTAVQVREHEDLSPTELAQAYSQTWPAALAGRSGAPEEARAGVHETDVHGVIETWTVGYMLDTILTRDVWMHRVDISRATGADLELTAAHDGVFVDDVVREWAERHGAPYVLDLDGPAGGHWEQGSGGEAIRLDAVEFCRILSGRAKGDGLLTTEVPF